jgi:phosphodiesterase/alkaline phosphatase D-like protein
MMRIALSFVLTLMPLAAIMAHSSIPGKEVFEATTLEEFLEASNAHNKKSERRLAVDEDSKPLLADYYGGKPGFYHGVASGDPLPEAVIVWTRFTPVNAADKVDIELRMAKVDATIPFSAHLDPSANPNLKRAKITVTGANDWIAKIDVTGLDSYTNYVFAFTDGVTSSMVGQTKTAPAVNAPVNQLVYAVYSCSHFANGYFHPYDVGSTIEELDFWIHLGDYVVSIEGRVLSCVIPGHALSYTL